MHTIIVAAGVADPDRGWGGLIGIAVAGLVFWAFVWVRGEWLRRRGDTTPSPTPPGQLRSRTNRQVTAGPHPSPDRSEPATGPALEPPPRSVVREAWTALRTGNPRPGDDLDDDVDEYEEEEDEETVEEYAASLLARGLSTSRIVRGMATYYPVSEQQAKKILLSLVQGESPIREVHNVVEEPPATGALSFEEYVAQLVAENEADPAGMPYMEIVRKASATHGKSESAVKREITKARGMPPRSTAA